MESKSYEVMFHDDGEPEAVAIALFLHKEDAILTVRLFNACHSLREDGVFFVREYDE